MSLSTVTPTPSYLFLHDPWREEPQNKLTPNNVSGSQNWNEAQKHAILFARSNTNDTGNDSGQTNPRIKLSKGQRKRRNRATKAAAVAAGRLASLQLTLPKPSAFLKLPADILSQIVPDLAPIDVLYLAQVNKSVRKMLMHRSARTMWRACMENIGLPACPPELSEPRYVSLLFQPRCSACGAKEGRRPDMYLRVRLCPPCRKQLLVDSREIEPEVRDLVPTSDKSCNGSQRYYALQFSLKHEVEVVVTHLRELQLSSEEVLQSWIQARKLELARQEEHTDLVTQFLTTARRNRTKELKRNWHEQVEQRLLALGWSQNEADLPREKQGQWRPLASRAQVLTEESWSRLEPVILGFLTTEAEDRVRREREQRSKILEGQFHGLQNDMDTLPDPIVGLPAAEIADTMAKWLPIPQYVDALEWPMIRDLLETDVSEAHMVDRFKQHRDEIILLITNWGRQVKREWASILREGRRKDGLVPDAPRPRLPASGAGRNLLEDLDPDTCLLLRADSIFAHRDQSSILSYDILMRSIQHGFNRFTTPRITRRDLFDLTAYTFHSEASGIARALLASLGQQDASVPEFNVVFGRWFLCGRCGNRYRMSWMCMVRRTPWYLDMNREYWNKVQPHLHKFSELGIAFKNRHALQSEDTRPLVIYLSGQEIDILVAKNRRFIRLTSWTEQTTEELAVLPPATATNVEDKVDEDNFQDDEDEDDEDEDEDEDEGSELAEYWNRDRLVCKLCEQGQLEAELTVFLDIPELFDHLRNAHDVSDLQRGLDLKDRDSIQNSPYFHLSKGHEGRSFARWGPPYVSYLDMDY